MYKLLQKRNLKKFHIIYDKKRNLIEKWIQKEPNSLNLTKKIYSNNNNKNPESLYLKVHPHSEIKKNYQDVH